jgi:hypothetical protein
MEIWMDPIAFLDTVEKRKEPCPCQESNPGHEVHNLIAILTETEVKKASVMILGALADLNKRFSKYKAEVLTTTLQCLVSCHNIT